MVKSYYNEDTGGYYSKQTGKRLHGAADDNAKAKHLNGDLKQTLDRNKELEYRNKELEYQIEQCDQALYYSLSLINEQGNLINEQGKKIQHLENTLGSFLSALNFDIPSLDFNKS